MESKPNKIEIFTSAELLSIKSIIPCFKLLSFSCSKALVLFFNSCSCVAKSAGHDISVVSMESWDESPPGFLAEDSTRDLLRQVVTSSAIKPKTTTVLSTPGALLLGYGSHLADIARISFGNLQETLPSHCKECVFFLRCILDSLLISKPRSSAPPVEHAWRKIVLLPVNTKYSNAHFRVFEKTTLLGRTYQNAFMVQHELTWILISIDIYWWDLKFYN